MNNKPKNSKQLALAMVGYSGLSIFGPLIVIGGIGYFLDRMFEANSVILIISVFIAFIVTNVLLFKKVKKINKMMDDYKERAYKDIKENTKEKKDQDL